LSRTETRAKGDKEDASREKEEQRLWNEDRLKVKPTAKQPVSPKSKTGLTLPKSPEKDVRAKSPWRTQRRAVAVVRPQPVVVMRSGSPAPKISESTRPSRLPLSTAVREKEKEALKKAATESSLPRPPSRTPSTPSRSSSMSTSTSSLETSSAPSSPLKGPYGLRRSATTTTGFGSSSSSASSYSLTHSR
ncbi:hypothetical protein OESDEN_21358, partial [Oesophagostomum dentatum]